MVRDVQHISLFNTEKVGEEVSTEDSAWKVDQFATTVKMSTYLVAFVVCDYNSSTTYGTNGRTKVRQTATGFFVVC